MTKKKLTNQSTAALKATDKNLRTALIIMLVLIIGFIGYSGYLVSSEKLTDTTLFTVVPVIFMIFSIFISGKKSQISSELRKREIN